MVISYMEIDLNCDLGEGCDLDAELMALITSANIACGFHAGSPEMALSTLRLALAHGVRVGAHPGFADKENFGRRELAQSELQIFADCVYQVGALMGLATAAGGTVRYIKPHGALYNLACRHDAYARPIVAVAKQFGLPVMGLPGSQLEIQARDHCPFVAEGFADRRYLPDGSLVPRDRPDAMLESVADAVQQAIFLIRKQGIRTLCVHGDNPQALAFVAALRTELLQSNIAIRAFA